MSISNLAPGNILLTQGTTALAQRVANGVLKNWPVILASSDPIPDVLLRSGNVKRIPSANHITFIHELLKLALDQNMHYVLTLDPLEQEQLQNAKPLFNEYDIELLEVMTNIDGEYELVRL